LGVHPGEWEIKFFHHLCVHPGERTTDSAHRDLMAPNNRRLDGQRHRPGPARVNTRNRRSLTGKHVRHSHNLHYVTERIRLVDDPHQATGEPEDATSSYPPCRRVMAACPTTIPGESSLFGNQKMLHFGYSQARSHSRRRPCWNVSIRIGFSRCQRDRSIRANTYAPIGEETASAAMTHTAQEVRHAFRLSARGALCGDNLRRPSSSGHALVPLGWHVCDAVAKNRRRH
jgi:hypothetical protein